MSGADPNLLKGCWNRVSRWTVPVVNLEVGELKDIIWEKLQEPKYQRKLVLVIVSIALLLDNMLYMVIVPIIPDYLRDIGAWGDEPGNLTKPKDGRPVHRDHHGQDSATGILFASKAIVQLMVNPFSGALIDRIGYDVPMMIGLCIMFLSTALFACGGSYGVLFFARSLQGVGSAFADTSGLAMIADRFTEEAERTKALGIALAFISFGCLVAPPFGGALYQFAGKEVPFLVLAFVSLLDGVMLLIVMRPLKDCMKDNRTQAQKENMVPIWRLLIDPYIAVCSGALMMANVALAFLEPTISLWMEDNLTTDNWKIGMIWLPAFFPHVFGVILTVKMAKKYPQHQWLMAAGGLALEGVSCLILPFSTSYKMLMIPLCTICFGIALIDTALLPTLGYLVDVRYVSVYGSIYAIADISYSVAYAIGPIIAGGVVEAIGFTALNIGIAISNLMYAPVLMYLRNIYDFKPFENDANILMSDPPDKHYQTYTMQDQQPIRDEKKNHLEYQSMDSVEETNIDGRGGMRGWREGWLAVPKRFFSVVTQETSPSAQLPKLPVPDLERTMGKYLDNLKPLVTESQFETTRLLVESFADPDGQGPKVQNALLQRREELDNWVYDWWLKDMYTGIPLCLPINVNPGMVLPPRQFKEFSDIARYAARLIKGLSDYKDQLDRRAIPVEKATSREKGQPLCMAQNYRLMTSYRVPGLECDTLINTEPEGARMDQHVIVACQNSLYALHLKRDGKALNEEEIAAHVLHILERNNEELVLPVGLLTSLPRNKWAEYRESLLKHEENRENLKLIETCLGLICLDQTPLTDKFQRRGAARGAKGLMAGRRDETNMAHQILHGGGSQFNSGNRWFEKTIQFVIGSDGVNGLCYEHSPSEAVALIGVIESILETTTDLESFSGGLSSTTGQIQEIKWVESPVIKRAVQEAAVALDNLIEDLDFYVYRFDGYGKNFIKSCKVSPDAYIQMALQLAYYRLYGKLTATYESASVRRFRLGRVDCIRSATCETFDWVSSMARSDDPSDPLNQAKRVTFNLISNEEKLKLFDAAMKKQTEVMIDNILGQGIDLHLLGLREQSKLSNCPLTLFEDDSYKKFNHFALSTSQVATKFGFMGYGPVVPDGYGASYNILEESVIFCISAFYSSTQTSSPRFAQSLEESLNAMQTLLQSRA